MSNGYWADRLTPQELRSIDRLAVSLGLPDRASYNLLEHFLSDVASRVAEAKSLIMQVNRTLGDIK